AEDRTLLGPCGQLGPGYRRYPRCQQTSREDLPQYDHRPPLLLMYVHAFRIQGHPPKLPSFCMSFLECELPSVPTIQEIYIGKSREGEGTGREDFRQQ
ncbi:MAG: hypothetical protein ACK56F_04220, partial [bacterium]